MWSRFRLSATRSNPSSRSSAQVKLSVSAPTADRWCQSASSTALVRSCGCASRTRSSRSAKLGRAAISRPPRTSGRAGTRAAGAPRTHPPQRPAADAPRARASPHPRRRDTTPLGAPPRRGAPLRQAQLIPTHDVRVTGRLTLRQQMPIGRLLRDHRPLVLRDRVHPNEQHVTLPQQPGTGRTVLPLIVLLLRGFPADAGRIFLTTVPRGRAGWYGALAPVLDAAAMIPTPPFLA